MTKIKSLGLKVIATAILGLSLIGCGGGGGSSSGDTATSDTTTNTGTFVDSPVEGLKYETATLSGFTDNKGNFQYKDGETITFKIGNLELGSARGGELMTPLTLTGENDLNNISSKATNIARILQSLDENSSNQGQIKLSSNLKDLNVSSVNLESEADLNTILQKAQTITSKAYILKDSITAKNEMKSYLNVFQNYSQLENKQYINDGSTFYFLNCTTNTKIDFTTSRYGGIVTFYDKNLNELNSSITGFNYLDAVNTIKSGTYLVKLKIEDTDYYHRHEDTYIDVYIHNSIDDLLSLETKKYTGDKTTFYSLKLDNSTKISFNSYASQITIYDKDLNKLDYSIGNDTIITLPQGNYIVKLKISHTYYNYMLENGYVNVSIF